MAAPVQSTVNCSSEQNPDAAPDSKNLSGRQALKNGTDQEEGGGGGPEDAAPPDVSQQQHNSKVKSPGQGRDVTMENFQDGGGGGADPTGHRRPVEHGYRDAPRPPDSSDMNSYGSDSGPNPHVDYGKMNDGHGQQQHPYYGRYPPPSMDQHGGPQQEMPGYHHHQQQQYGGHPSLRPSYPQGGGGKPLPPNSAQQQRFLGGPPQQHPPGPTPTLNQLLQSPNPVQRYHNSYGEYGMGPAGKGAGGSGGGDLGGGGAPGPYPGAVQGGWGSPRGMPAGYPPQMNNAVGYRNQAGSGGAGPPPMHEMSPGHGSRKRPAQPQPTYMGSSPGGYGGPGGMQQPSPQSPQAQYASQYPQRYPSPQGRSGPIGMGNQPYSSQMAPQYTQPPQQGPLSQMGNYDQRQIQGYLQQQHSPQGYQGGRPQQQQPPNQQQQPQPPPSSQQGQGPPQQHTPPHSSSPTPLQQQQHHHQQQQQQSAQAPPPSSSSSSSSSGATTTTTTTTTASTASGQSKDNGEAAPATNSTNANSTAELSGSLDDAQSENSNQSVGGSSQGTASSSQGLQPGVSPLRPTPSPSGSSGSRSMSPAVGAQLQSQPPTQQQQQQQQNIPMPPRPSSSQSDNSQPGRMSQSPMAAQGYNQPMPSSHMGPPMYGGKMHPNMMSPFSPQSQQYPQGNYGRAPSGMGMQGYGGSYHNNQTNSMGGHPYHNRMSGHMGGGGGPAPQGYPNQYMNNQYGAVGQGYGVGGPMVPSSGPTSASGPGGPQGPPQHLQGPPQHSPQHPHPHPQGQPHHPQGGQPLHPQSQSQHPQGGPPSQQHQQPPQQQQQSNSGMPPMTPNSPASSKGSPIPVGAQVAAQAAVIAAANSNTPPMAPQRHPSHPTTPQSGMFMNKHMHHPRGGYGPPGGPPPHMNYSGGPPPPGMSQQMLGGPPMVNSRGDSPGMPTVTSMPPPAIPTSTTPTPANSSGPPSSSPGAMQQHPPHQQMPPQSGTGTPPVGPMNENSCDASNESNPNSLSNSSVEMRGGPNSGMGGMNSDSGAMQDEASQHSTASNVSTADERAETPRPRKDIPVSHPPTPASALPSPGAASMSSYHDDFESVSSPSWPRTPASPGSQHMDNMDNMEMTGKIKYQKKRPVGKRADGLHKLYDISEEPERRMFLDRLIQFNEDRGTAITQCPTISKHPLDLYRLYLAVKSRSGFLDVTKGKLWKDVAGQVGVGASSSGAYTLRKQYIKHLLPFECKFDRGGIDPLPIISQVESTTRKKTAKAAAAPSPGSSNSQDSFQQNNSQSMDGFSNSQYGNQYSSGGHGPPGEYGGGGGGGGGGMPPMGQPAPGQGMPMDSHHSSPHHPAPMMTNHSGGHPPTTPASGGAPTAAAGPAAGGATGGADSINVQNPFDDVQHSYPRNGMGPGGMGPGGPYGGYNHHQRPPPAGYGGPGAGPAGNQSGTASPYAYPDAMGRGGSAGGPPPPSAAGPPPPSQTHEPYAGDQYPHQQHHRPPAVNHDGYGSGRPMPEPFTGPGAGPAVPAATNYSHIRPVGMQSGAPSHYNYGQQYDRERFEQQPGNMPNDQSIYPQHRYGPQQPQQQPIPRPYLGSGPGPAPGQSPGPSAMGPPAPAPGSQSSQCPPTSTPPASFPTPQDGSYQNYPPGQQGMYPSPNNKMMVPHPYPPQGPKRHPDFLKPTDTSQQYPYGGAPPPPGGASQPPAAPGQTPLPTSTSPQQQQQQPPTVPPPTQQVPPTSTPPHGIQPSQAPPPSSQPPAPYAGWRGDSQYQPYHNQGPHPGQQPPPTQQQSAPTPPQSGVPPPTQSREDWEQQQRAARHPPLDSGVANQWPSGGMHPHQRYPTPPAQQQVPSGGGLVGPVGQQPPQPSPPHNYYYQGNNGGAPPPSPGQPPPPPHMGMQGGGSNVPNAGMRMRPSMKDKHHQQPPQPQLQSPQQHPMQQHQPPFSPGPQPKMPPPPMGPNNQQYPPKRDIVFPPNCVESVTPVLVKRKRMTPRDVSPVEAWRLMMALKSGLLCESTWALDVLNVLLYDDGTVLYFNLQHLPGFLDTLLEHFRRCLVRMFGLGDELEVGNVASATVTNLKRAETAAEDLPEPVDDSRWFEAGRRKGPAEGEAHLRHLGAAGKFEAEHKHVILDGPNYTYNTRQGKPVKALQRAEDLFVSDDPRVWDTFEGFESRAEHWEAGGGDISTHVQTHFENDATAVPFVRLMADVVRLDAEDSEEKLKGEMTTMTTAASSPAERKAKAERECVTVSENCAQAAAAVKVERSVEVSVVSAIEIKLEPKEEEDVVAVKPENLNSSARRTCDKSPPATGCVANGAATVAEVTNSKEGSLNTTSALASSSPPPSKVVKDETLKKEGEVGSAEVRNADVEEMEVDGEEDDEPSWPDSPAPQLSAETVERAFSAAQKRKRKAAGEPQADDEEERYEDEAYNRDEPSLFLVTDAQDSLMRRCLCVSNILRSLSFVPGNDTELAKSPGFLLLMGKLLVLHHQHTVRRPSQQRNIYDRAGGEEETAAALAAAAKAVPVADTNAGCCSSLSGEREWWWDTLHTLRENTLVVLANIAGQLDLSCFREEVGLPLLDGLLHWAVCPSAYAQDPLPTGGCSSGASQVPGAGPPSQGPPGNQSVGSSSSALSPQRLSLEALCKLSVLDNNVDLLLATPPFSRVERLFGFLSRSLGRHEEQVVREFSVVLLHYFAQADSSIARAIALHHPSISLLIAFVEQAEQSALNIANSHGITMLRDNPDVMGTSLDMLRRAAHTLLCLARAPENRPLFVQHQHRLLQLVTSQILDQHVASIVADVLYECSLPAPAHLVAS